MAVELATQRKSHRSATQHHLLTELQEISCPSASFILWCHPLCQRSPNFQTTSNSATMPAVLPHLANLWWYCRIAKSPSWSTSSGRCDSLSSSPHAFSCSVAAPPPRSQGSNSVSEDTLGTKQMASDLLRPAKRSHSLGIRTTGNASSKVRDTPRGKLFWWRDTVQAWPLGSQTFVKASLSG